MISIQIGHNATVALAEDEAVCGVLSQEKCDNIKNSSVGAVLNTSFNLHGYPLVSTPEQAVFTMENSALRYLALENYLICKKEG